MNGSDMKGCGDDGDCSTSTAVRLRIFSSWFFWQVAKWAALS
jgi:hypothetical protein